MRSASSSVCSERTTSGTSYVNKKDKRRRPLGCRRRASGAGLGQGALMETCPPTRVHLAVSWRWLVVACQTLFSSCSRAPVGSSGKGDQGQASKLITSARLRAHQGPSTIMRDVCGKSPGSLTLSSLRPLTGPYVLRDVPNLVISASHSVIL